MHPRIVCNVVFAHLLGDASPEDREKFVDELYATSGKPVDMDRLGDD